MRTQLNNILKATALIMASLAITLTTSCDVHQWPDTPETVAFHLKLDYKTDMTLWPHSYDGENMVQVATGPDTASVRPYGTMRYIVRAYPSNGNNRSIGDYSHQFILTRDIAQGYNNDTTLHLPPGNYNIMVWSDIKQVPSHQYLYNYSNFGEITLTDLNKGNDEWKDAFRGTGNITLVADIMERQPDTLNVTMERPLAKYEFVTTDVLDFVRKEITRAEAKSKADGTYVEGDTKVDLNDYRVELRYVGFMPMAYSMYTDKPVDSTTGVVFTSKLKSLSETDASLGFDYVMVNGNESAVTLQIVIYDKENLCLSTSEPIKVPLRRSYHTIVKGMLLMSEASGGVSINPEYEGDHNLIFK